jgi:hypothetical protein
MTPVHVPHGGRLAEDTTVDIDGDGRVFLHGVPIGRVAKGHSYYSPPVHKGSQIVKYHKKMSEWHGYKDGRPGRPTWRCDTRREVLQRMIVSYNERKEQA